MKQPLATLCSFALMLWAYQTGLWVVAIPMILILEGRGFIPWRGKVSREYLQFLHVSAALIWVVTVVALPPTTPVPVQYAARYQLLRGLPIAIFPLIFAHTYSTNLQSLYGTVFLDRRGNERKINLYVLYFGLCLISASVTGGHPWLFGLCAIALTMGLLLTYQSSRHSPGTLVGLMLGALAMSLLASAQLNWFHANVKIPNPFTMAAQSLAQLWDRTFPDVHPGFNPNVDWADLENYPDFDEPFELSNAPDEIEQGDSELPQTPDVRDNDSPPNESSGGESSASNVAGERPAGSGGSGDSGNGGAPQEEPGTPTTENPTIDSEEYYGDENPFDEASESIANASSGDISAIAATETTGSSTSSNAGGSSDPETVWGTQGAPTLAQARQQVASVVDPEQTKTRIGSLGALQQSNAVLFRIKPGASAQRMSLPLYMREATYDSYAKGAWNAQDSGFTTVALENGRWSLGDESGTQNELTVSGLQQVSGGLLKLPLGTSLVEDLPLDRLKVNRYGTAVVDSQTKRNLSYRLRFNPRQSFDLAPTSLDSSVPEAERSALREVLNGLDLDGQSDGGKVRAIERFFQKDFVYSLELVPPEKGKSPLESFLLKHRSGHCEYYASATTLLLREAGIPARYTVGYSVSERDPVNGDLVVRLRDAHAWVTAYVDGDWKTVETTPGGGTPQLEDALGDTQAFEQVVAEQIAQEQRESGREDREKTGESTADAEKEKAQGPVQEAIEQLEQVTKPGIDWLKALSEWVRDIGNEVLTWVKQQIGSNIWFASFLALGVAIAVGATVVIVRLLRKKKPRWLPKKLRQAKKTQPIGFQDIESYLEEQKLGRGAAETPKRWILRLEKKLSHSQVVALQEILDLHYRDRFDPEGLSIDEKRAYLEQIQQWLSEARSPQKEKSKAKPSAVS